jgi:hypothetical protein
MITLTYNDSSLPLLKVIPTKENNTEYVTVCYNDDDLTTTKCKHKILYNHFNVSTRTLKEKGVYLGSKEDGLFIPTLCYSHVQSWLKRTRINLKRALNKKDIHNEETLRYFVCGEYGPTTYRPHYHVLLWCDTHKSLQVCCENLPATWKFGNIVTKVADCNSSYYVASYVTSHSALPPFLRVGVAKPTHHGSRFLGQDVLRLSKKEAYESEPSRIIERSLPVGGKMQNVRMSPSLITRYFPKVRGFAVKNDADRLRGYRIYLEARRTFGDIPLPVMASRIAADCIEGEALKWDGLERDNDIYDDLTIPQNGLNNTSNFNSDSGFYVYPMSSYFADLRFTTEEALRQTVWYNGDHRNFSTVRESIKDVATFRKTEKFRRFCTKIYGDLLKSRHFIKFCCQGDERYETTLKIFSAIKRFYKWCDGERLKKWYTSQEEFYSALEELGDEENYLQLFDFSKDITTIDEETGEIYTYSFKNEQNICPFFYDNTCSTSDIKFTDSKLFTIKRNLSSERIRKRTKTKKINDVCGVLRATA